MSEYAKTALAQATDDSLRELSAPMTSTQRGGLLRKRRAADGLAEVRGIWAPSAYHADVKAEAAKLIARSQRRDRREAG